MSSVEAADLVHSGFPQHRCGKWSALAVGGGFLLISSHGQGHQGEDLGINLDRSGHIGT